MKDITPDVNLIIVIQNINLYDLMGLMYCICFVSNN